MIRMRGLDHALGRVIEKVLGRKDNHDSDEASQWRRLTTSARRQWEATPVAKDVHHMDDATDEVHE